MTHPTRLPEREQGSDPMNGLTARPESAPPTVRSSGRTGVDEVSTDRLMQTVVIRNPQGLHMRAAAFFVQRANGFQSAVAIWKSDQRANGKSLWDLMLLAATQGTELVLEVTGVDAPAALTELAETLAAPGNAFDSDGADQSPAVPLKG